MSVNDVMVRIQELQHLIGGRVGAPVAKPQGDFAATLAGAATPAVSPAAAASPLGLGATDAATAIPPAPGAVTGMPFANEINAAAARHKLDPALLAGLIRQESNFNPSAVSPAGARGLTQLMPGTAAGLGVKDSSDPVQSIEGGARYLRQQLDRFGGDPSRALAAYNAGPGAVLRHGGVPPYAETQAYVRKVQEFASQYQRSAVPVPAPMALPASAAQGVGQTAPPVTSRSGGLNYSTL